MNEINLPWTVFLQLIFMPRVLSWSPDVRAQKLAVTCLLPVDKYKLESEQFSLISPLLNKKLVRRFCNERTLCDLFNYIRVQQMQLEYS